MMLTSCFLFIRLESVCVMTRFMNLKEMVAGNIKMEINKVEM